MKIKLNLVCCECEKKIKLNWFSRKICIVKQTNSMFFFCSSEHLRNFVINVSFGFSRKFDRNNPFQVYIITFGELCLTFDDSSNVEMLDYNIKAYKNRKDYIEQIL